MKEKIFLILIIISLLAINAFTLVRFYQLKQQKSEGEEIKHNKESDELNSYMVNFSTNILNSNFQLNNILVRDSLNNTIPLKTAFNYGQKQILVCRFSKMHCESCVNFAIQNFRNWVDSIGIKNVLFLGNYHSNKIFNREKPLYGIQGMNVYNAFELKIPAEELGYPYYFILDRNLRISNVFVPDKAAPEITNRYLKNIQSKF